MLARVVFAVVGLRGVIILVGVIFALPVLATEMQPLEAKRFIVGKSWSYRCFDGTKGSGRAFADGSISGTIQEGGAGPTRTELLPAGTIKVGADLICAPGRRLMGFITPCFTVRQRDAQSFRGSISWLPFLFCDFVRTNRGQATLN